jgi:hypothetical protein
LTSIALLIGIGIIAAVITLLFVFMFETIINDREGEGEGGPKLSNPDKQFMKVESVADGLSFPTSMEFIDNENIWFEKKIMEQYALFLL